MKDEFIQVGNSDGWLEIPKMVNHEWDIKDLIGFNFVMNRPRHERTVHFFIPDKEFVRVWNDPSRYVPVLERFNGAFSPDFSMYRDSPLVIQMYNTFRNRWCGRLWQESGINVIPTIGWSDSRSYEFAFLGVEPGGIIATSTRGAIKEKEATELFVQGYMEMMERLDPKLVIMFGCRLEGLPGNIRWFDYDYLKTEALGADKPHPSTPQPEIALQNSLEEAKKDISPADPIADAVIADMASKEDKAMMGAVKNKAVRQSNIPEGAHVLSISTDIVGMVVKVKYMLDGKTEELFFDPPIEQKDI